MIHPTMRSTQFLECALIGNMVGMIDVPDIFRHFREAPVRIRLDMHRLKLCEFLNAPIFRDSEDIMSGIRFK